MDSLDAPTPPRPHIPTVQMVQELAAFVTGRQPMTETTRQLLEHAVSDQKNQIKLFLAALGAHKMKRMADLVRAIDICAEKLLDPKKIAQIDDPAELRRYVRLLREIEDSDLEFLLAQASTGAEKRGFSDDPRNQFNFFYQSAVAGEAVLPDSLSQHGRRSIHGLMQALTSFGAGGGQLRKPPAPPMKLQRAEIVAKAMESKAVDERIASGNGSSPRPTSPPR